MTGQQLDDRLEQVLTNEQAIEDETTRAEGAEQTLQDNIDAEELARQQAIEAEAAARDEAIAAERERAEGVEATKANASDVYTKTEANDAIDAAVLVEKERAEGAEQILQENIDAEAGTRAQDDEGLQGQINEIVSGDTTVGLSSSNAAVFADGENHGVNFTATSSPTPADITFKEKGSGEEGETVENVNSHVFPVTVNSTTQVTKTYQAAFIVAGVNKGIREASVKLVYPIFVGAGVNYAGGSFTQASVRPNPAGQYNITTALGDHLLFDVPAGMTISKVLLYDDPSFPTEVAVEPVASSRTGRDGSAYTCYQSVSTFAAGTHKYKVES